MGDAYIELLVKKKKTGKDTAIQVLMGVGVAVLVFLGLMQPLFWLLALALGAASYFVFQRLNLEYEYLYVNGELDVDKIFSQSRRKRAGSYDVNNMEVLAPVKSHQLDSYNNNSNVKTVDYTSLEENARVFAMVVSADNQLIKVLFEPNDEMLKEFKNKAPRKVFMD